ncbi:MAG: Gfo/Idh/MocA family protein [Pirellulales bacterium]
MKAAVIGLGPHGRRIVDVLRALGGVELAAVVDRSEAALAALELPESVARCRSDEELWSRGDVGLVCVATNGPSHAALAVAAMKAGVRRLLVEKPMACSLAECDQILAAARRTGTRVAVDHGRRHAPVYQWLRTRIASGDWGQVRAIWMQRPDIGLGCNGTHSFDTVTYLADADVERVTGWVDKPIKKNPRGEQFVDPGGTVIMELAGGARALVAQIEDGAGPTSLEIDMTAARIRFDERTGGLEIIERDLSIKPGPNRPAVFQQTAPPTDLPLKLDMPTMIRGCLTELVAEAPLAGDGRHGRAAVEVLVAAYLSQQRGNVPVKLPLEQRDELNLRLAVT